MKIFTALFRKSSPASLPEPPPRNPYQRHIESLRKHVSECIDATQLAQYARDPSGFVRQAAMARCTELARADMLPILASRLNDWVPEVRNAAQAGMDTLLPLVHALDLLTILPSIQRLLHAGRFDHAEWVEGFERKVIERVPLDAFINGAQGSAREIARSCYRILKQYRLIAPKELVRLSLKNRDDLVIAHMAIQSCSALPLSDRLQLYRDAVHSHFAVVRTIALRALLAAPEYEAKKELALQMLFDRQGSTRSVGVHYLQGLGFNVGTQYRQALADPQDMGNMVRIALIALGNVGTSDDVDLVQRYVKAEKSAIRLAALMAWFKLDNDAKDDIAKNALCDHSPRVCKLAPYLVDFHGAYIPFTFIQEVLRPRGNKRMLLHFARAHKWTWLLLIAEQAKEGSGNANELVRELRAWLGATGGGYASATADERRHLSLSETWEALHPLLGRNARDIDLLRYEIARMKSEDISSISS